MPNVDAQHPEVRALIVDDHELASEGVKLTLNARAGFNVVGVCHHGMSVITSVRDLQPDIVLLDLNLPDRNGLDVLTELVELDLAPVLILTGEVNAIDFHTALKAGAKGIVSKLDPASCVVDGIQDTISGDGYLSPKVAELLRGVEPVEVSLSPRQSAILDLMAEGETNKEISYRLGISPTTVSFHLREMRFKLGVKGNKKILNRATELGLIGRGT
jgi:DNA-binding NarL/FixJ family response regulator